MILRLHNKMIKNNVMTIVGQTLCLAVITFSLSFAMDADLWSLPFPAGAEIIWKDKPVKMLGISASSTHIRSFRAAQDLLDFYKQALLKNNWELTQDAAMPNTLVLKKEDRFFYVFVSDNPAGLPADVYLVSSPRDLAMCNVVKDYMLQGNIAQDTPGEDFSDIARYPGSKRRLDVFTPLDGAMLMYETEAQPEEVARFYRQNLKASGWKEEYALTEDIINNLVPQTKKDLAIMLFNRGKDTVVIDVIAAAKEIKPQERLSKRTLIIINRNMEGLITPVDQGGR